MTGSNNLYAERDIEALDNLADFTQSMYLP